jgi:hypothetical protein
MGPNRQKKANLDHLTQAMQKLGYFTYRIVDATATISASHPDTFAWKVPDCIADQPSQMPRSLVSVLTLALSGSSLRPSGPRYRTLFLRFQQEARVSRKDHMVRLELLADRDIGMLLSTGAEPCSGCDLSTSRVLNIVVEWGTGRFRQMDG